MILYLSNHQIHNVSRPCLHCESENAEDSFWSTVEFDAVGIDPYEICVKRYEKIILEITQCEIWEFLDCRISLSAVHPHRYVIIFDKCQRVSRRF